MSNIIATAAVTESAIRAQIEAFPAAYQQSVESAAAFGSDEAVDNAIEWADGCYLTACHYLRSGDLSRANNAINGANRSLATVAERVSELGALCAA